MIYHYLKSGHPLYDHEFDSIYPPNIRRISKTYWTPVEIAIKAAKFLVKNKETKVLDIGAGIGKFCFIGAAVTKGKFIGVEQREDYVKLAKNSLKTYNVENVHFIQSNINEIDFSIYNSFYFFNPFYENLIHDEDNSYQPALYYAYSNYVKSQLDLLPLGTRVVTYHGSNDEIPLTYEVFSFDNKGLLKFWIKNHEIKEQCLIEEQFIRNGISRLKIMGFTRVNEQNIFHDEVYKTFFRQILNSQLGRGKASDEIALTLLTKIDKS